MNFFQRFLTWTGPVAPTRDVPFVAEHEVAERVTPRWPRPQQQWLVYSAPEFPAAAPAERELERVDAARDEAP